MKKSLIAFFGVFVLAFSFASVSAMRADFAIYSGSGTWEPSKTAFKNFLEWKGLTWEEVNKNVINEGRLTGNYRGLFMPGGWAGDYNRDIKASGDQHIRNFISQGGAYIGMSAGAYYACDVTIWEGDVLDYPSNIFNGDCVGPIENIAPWPEYTMTTMDINLGHEAMTYEPAQRDVLYYGEPYFVAHPGQEMQTFASWKVPSDPAADGKPGIVGFNYGSGRVLLVGPHPEIDEDDLRDGTDFGSELSDGVDGSDWPFLWTSVDWILHEEISQPPGVEPPAPKQCGDGIDNDGDGFIDLADVGCSSALDDDETDPLPVACSDGIDNDGDGFIDLADVGCSSSLDDDEFNAVGPATLLFDNFEDGNLNGWTTNAVSGGNVWTVVSINPYQGVYHAQSKPMSTTEPASVLERSVSTSGYVVVTVNYYRKLVGLDIADEFKAKWFDGVSWRVLEQTGSSSANDAGYVLKSFVLPASAGNNANFKIRFECTAGAVSEFCRVDNVEIVGQ